MEKCKRAAEEAAAMKSVKPSEVATSDVSFFQAGLVCTAAPKIGCGSRAKPALLALTANSHVAGAWLNEAGTRLAIAWKPNAKPLTLDQLDAVLDGHGVALQPVSAETSNELLTSFKADSEWYDAAGVDRLSEQEAGIIAARIVRRFAAKTSLTAEQQMRLRNEFENAIRSRLTKGGGDDWWRDEMLTVAKPLIDPKALSTLEQVVALGYRPLANEE